MKILVVAVLIAFASAANAAPSEVAVEKAQFPFWPGFGGMGSMGGWPGYNNNWNMDQSYGQPMTKEEFPIDYAQSCSNSCRCVSICVRWNPCDCRCPPPCPPPVTTTTLPPTTTTTETPTTPTEGPPLPTTQPPTQTPFPPTEPIVEITTPPSTDCPTCCRPCMPCMPCMIWWMCNPCRCKDGCSTDPPTPEPTTTFEETVTTTTVTITMPPPPTTLPPTTTPPCVPCVPRCPPCMIWWMCTPCVNRCHNGCEDQPAPYPPQKDFPENNWDNKWEKPEVKNPDWNEWNKKYYGQY